MSIEEREQEERNLGEIDEMVLRDPAARTWPEPYIGDHDIPPAINALRKIANKEQSTGQGVLSPPTADVRSVFDSRPVNGQDFYLTGTVQINAQNVRYSTIWTVPTGYFAIVRSFRFSPDAEPAAISPLPSAVISPVRPVITFAVNGIMVPGIANVRMDVTNNREFPCFFYASPGDTITLFMDYQTEINIAADPFPVFAELYGNYLLASGIPPQYEVGNYKPPVVSQSSSMRGARGSFSPAPQVQQQQQQTKRVVPKARGLYNTRIGARNK